MKKLVSGLIASVVCVVCLFAACKKDSGAPEKEGSHRLEANLMMDKKLFTNSFKERNAKDVFEIMKVSRENDLLEVRVKGGGAAESFQFVWDGSILLSYPAGIQLLLKYDNSKQDFDADKEMSITVNLQKIVGAKHNVNDFYFNVINGSKLQTVVLDPNGVSTSETR